MNRDSYVALAQERIQFISENKQSKCYASVCSVCHSCARLCLLALVESYGNYPPWDSNLDAVNYYCVEYIPGYTGFTAEQFVGLDDDCDDKTRGGFFEESDMLEVINDLNTLIKEINNLLQKWGHTPLKEI